MRVPKRLYATIYQTPLADLPDNPTPDDVLERRVLTLTDHGNGVVYLDDHHHVEIGSVERFTRAAGASFSGWVARVGHDYTATTGMTKAQALSQLAHLAEDHLNAKLTTANGHRAHAHFAALAS